MLRASRAAHPRRLSGLLLPAIVAPLLVLSGCADRTVDVAVQQPIAFPHRTHLDYFASGRHRTDRIKMHVDMLGLTEVPPELAEGRCVECHDNLAEKTACAGCHVLFQDATLRNRKDIRRCVACHRGAWTGSRANIPSATVCRTCHGADSTIDTAADKKLRAQLAGVTDVSWIQINTVAPNVYFSHPAHVRFNAIGCTTCHADVRDLAAPPTTALVFSMTTCLRCHVKNQASTDCLTCHK